ncbi:MAG: aminoacyl-tRNA hydrolase [Proteobacteria bacterium]|nr:aminoacyl-tRNA hydrolase [Pseudomonadota bacterium]
MYLLVGLGNIGPEYESTRHNFGFLLLDQIIDDYDFTLQSKKFKSEVFSGVIADQRIIALKPQTFMNRSGIAVLEAANFYKINPKNILVFHDDLDLALGKIRVKTGGGNAGHNGLKSLDEMIGKHYTRLRLGIGRPESKEYQTADYVLGKFACDEIEKVKIINEKISELIEEMIEGRVDSFLNKFYL